MTLIDAEASGAWRRQLKMDGFTMLFRAARTSLEIQIALVVRKPPWWGTWREMWKRTSMVSTSRIVALVECVETVPSKSWPRSQRWDSTSTLVNREDMKRCGNQLTKSWNTVKVRCTSTSLLFQLQREHSLASNCTGPIFLPPRDDLVLTDPNDRSRNVNKDKRWGFFHLFYSLLPGWSAKTHENISTEQTTEQCKQDAQGTRDGARLVFQNVDVSSFTNLAIFLSLGHKMLDLFRVPDSQHLKNLVEKNRWF